MNQHQNGRVFNGVYPDVNAQSPCDIRRMNVRVDGVVVRSISATIYEEGKSQPSSSNSGACQPFKVHELRLSGPLRKRMCTDSAD